MQRSNHLRTTVAGLAIIVSAFPACAAWAQEARAPNGALTAADAAENMEITVTARRREETLLQIPVAISAMSDKVLEARGVKDLQAISSFTPGFQYVNENLGRNDRGFTTLTFRGMEAGTFLATRQPAQAFLDGIPIVGGNIPGLDDVERVEVIKGPQSAYFGRSTFSGAINFISKNPSYEWGGRIKADVGRFGSSDTNLMVEGPLVADKLAFRLSGRYYTTDGQYVNAADSAQRLGARSTKSVAGTLLYEPTDNFHAKLFLGVWKDRDGPAADALTGEAQRNCNPLGGPVNTYVCGKIPTIPASQIGKVTTVTQRFRDLILQNGANLASVIDENFLNGAGLERHAIQSTVALGYEFDSGIGIDLSGGYNYNAFEIVPGTSVSNSTRRPNPNFGVIPGAPRYQEELQTRVDQENFGYGGELRISSPAKQDFRWMLGVSSFFQQAQGRSFGEGTTPTGFNDSALVTDRDVLTTGVFTALAYDFFTRFTINLEARYQWDNVNSQVTKPTPGPVYKKTFKSFQPRAILQFKATDDINLYVSAARSYRPGDFNANLGQFTDAERAEIERETGASSIVLAQEKLWMYEGGIKGKFFDGRLTGTLAGYYGDWTNIQVFTNLTIGRTPANPLGRGIDIATASGDATLYGAEFEGSLKLSDSLTADFGFAYTRVKLGSNYLCSACGPLIGTRTVTGKQKARVPEYTGNFGLTYSRPISDTFNIVAHADFIYRGTSYAEDANLAETGAAKKVNATIGLQRPEYSISLYATNIFNNKVINAATSTVNNLDLGSNGLGRALSFALPDKPTYGIRAVYNF
jgi:iron complex outermembrane receptor protein